MKLTDIERALNERFGEESDNCNSCDIGLIAPVCKGVWHSFYDMSSAVDIN